MGFDDPFGNRLELVCHTGDGDAPRTVHPTGGPWRPSSGRLVQELADRRLHVLSACGHWTMIEKTADFLQVVEPFRA
ncbi:hypothetical protein Z951_27765 [Streptomyces sp. PRh5]|uniref:hypothetical protein n=1 Tax=Streptomyces sp. PRh5 TaxID=1158056 RepID=UPI00044E3CD6|nr:hypothetical protein [Streptomyces sp. PRh5]EXU64992.1 hypothetical protein Z951_27765 [Streptomyces sp. PRh5]